MPNCRIPKRISSTTGTMMANSTIACPLASLMQRRVKSITCRKEAKRAPLLSGAQGGPQKRGGLDAAGHGVQGAGDVVAQQRDSCNGHHRNDAENDGILG